MTKLTDTQTILLSHAAQRDNGSMYPLPATITAPRPAVAKSLASLVSRGFAEERETDDADAVARIDGDLRYGLFITAAGKAAIGIEDGDGDGDDAGGPPSPAPVASAAPRQTKAALVLALLRREDGATLPELIEATGWLPHTTRAALTRLRKKGHELARSRRDDAPCYSIASAA